MKLFKKLLSYIIAVTMVLSLATLLGGNVHAAQPYTLTIEKTKANHKYAVYKVFGGDLKVDGDTKTLSNVVWGNGVDGSALLGELQRDPQFNKLNDKKETYNVFASAEEAKDVARILSDNYTGFDSTGAKAFAQDVGLHLSTAVTFGEGKDYVESSDSSTTITLPEPGYYFVKDKDAVTGEDASTRFIVQVVGNASVDVKSSVPTVTKKVDDKNDSTGDEETLKDSADYDIGDEVPYTITGTMPSNIDDYDSYKYVFTDTMSKGLTYEHKDNERGNAIIKIGDTPVTQSFTEKVEAVKDQNGKETGETKVTWTCANLRDIKGVTLNENTKVVVTYSAKLNESAVIGAAGNPNTVDLTYSNNPNKGSDGETGKTPEDKNIVFTYKTVINKVKKDGASLAGAGFTLYKKVNGYTGESNYKSGYKQVKKFTAGTAVTFEFKGLDDGDYALVESDTPAGYNTMDPIEFSITAEHNLDSENPQLIKLNGFEATGEVTLSGNQKAKVDKTAGSITANVVNYSGSVLPSTGGMGTTLLYVAGGILVACAAAYVVLNKKRA